MSPTPTPWELVPATEHHGPYITSPWGTTLCDLYSMSNPGAFSTASGGTSKPIPFVDADDNAHLIVTAVNVHADLLEAAKYALDTIDGNYPELAIKVRAAIEKAEIT